jgi:hypothetical protein
MFSRFTKRLSPLRAAAIVIPAAVLAAAVAVGPSFAGSFLTPEKAAHTYLTKKKAKSLYLKDRQASRSYVSKSDAPVAATAASTAAFGPVSSGDDPVDVPGSSVNFTMPKTGLVSLTYSGVSSCEANQAGVGCPFQIVVDGYPASTGASAIQTASKTGFGPDASVHSLTQTSVVGAGPHTASLQLASTEDAPTVKFGLKSWNLVVEGFPGT